MEEIIGVIVRNIFQFIAYYFFGIFCFYLGWPFVKLFTFGKFPSHSKMVGKMAREDVLVGCVGLIVLISTMVGIYYIKNM